MSILLTDAEVSLLLEERIAHHNGRMRQLMERNDPHAATIELGGVLGLEGALRQLDYKVKSAQARREFNEQQERARKLRAHNREAERQPARLNEQLKTGGTSDRKSHHTTQ